MDVVALDGTKLVALMAAGGAFALAGLWLMFRPQPGSEAARIELFGAKFQASSAGLLVFLIGAGFLVIPVVVPEKPAPAGADVRAAVVPQPTTDPAAKQAATGEGAGIVLSRPDRIAVHGDEAEPNNSLAEANVLSLGSAVNGNVEEGDPDFFIIEITDGTEGEVVFNATARYVEMTVYDDVGAVLWTERASDFSTFKLAAEHARYGVRLGQYQPVAPGHPAHREIEPYHLTVALRPR